MSERFVDHRGRRIELGTVIGKGGEGTVYEVVGQVGAVAKLYHSKAIPDTKAAKLKVMVEASNDQLFKVSAWPKATVHSETNRAIRGIIMDRVSGYREIHTLYSPAHRNSAFPKADWGFLLRTAENLARAFSVLHRNGQVIGDVNQSNVLVASDALVKLIDTDSFRVSFNGRSFPCEVGVPLFTPPELQGKNFRDVDRLESHDLFGLAVLIFHLLFMGRHPFSGRSTGSGDGPTIEQAISEGRFAFSVNAARLQMQPPPHAPQLTLVPRPVAELFEQAFAVPAAASSRRPSAQQWLDGLSRISGELNVCKTDRGHRYGRHLSSCPWCDLVTRGSPNFFVTVSVQATLHSGPRTIASFQLRINGLKILERSFLTASSGVSNTAPPEIVIPPEIPLQRPITQTIAVCVAVIGILLCFTPLIPIGLPIVFGMAIWWAVMELDARDRYRGANSMRNELLARLRRSTQEMRRAIEVAEWERAEVKKDIMSRVEKGKTGLGEFVQRAKAALTQYQRLDGEFAAQRSQLEMKKRELLLDAFLRQFFISDAQLPRIGQGRVATLESFGIETAADIEDYALSLVPGFGQVLISTLIAWRSALASQFRFNPSTALPQGELNRLLQRQTHQRNEVFNQAAVLTSEAERCCQRVNSELLGCWAKHDELSRRLADMTHQRTAADGALARATRR